MIGFAKWEDRPALAELWQVCFEEERRYANFFFNNAFRPENCLVYRVAGRPAAMLHLLPAKIVCGGKPVRIHYVFACATAPEHRSHGYMNALLAYAALVGSQREEQFSAILPASPGLYDYYAKSGYMTFFERDEYRLSAEQLREKAAVRRERRAFTPATLNRMRGALLRDREGAVLWENGAFWFAVEDNRIYGGKLVCAEGPSYAVCRREQPDVCEITEFMSAPEHLPALFAALLQEMPVQDYHIRLPKGSGLFAAAGVPSLSAPEPAFCGMLRPLDGTSMEQIHVGDQRPYLGLGKD